MTLALLGAMETDIAKHSEMLNFIYKLNPESAPQIMYKALKDRLEP